MSIVACIAATSHPNTPHISVDNVANGPPMFVDIEHHELQSYPKIYHLKCICVALANGNT